MPDWAIYLIVSAGLLGLPFYVFLLSKLAAIGRLSGTYEFMKRCPKGDPEHARCHEDQLPE